MYSKKKIRQKFRNIRKSVTNCQNKSIEIGNNIINNIPLKKINTLGLYIPFDGEVDIFAFIHNIVNNCVVILAFPFVDCNNEMFFCTYNKNDSFTKHSLFSFMQPEKINRIIVPDMLLVPTVSFDYDCYRLGMGKGFYDNFISQNKKKYSIITVGIAYSDQLCENIPIEDHDQKLNFIVTEKYILSS